MVYESRVKSMHTMNCFPGFGDTGGDMVFSQGNKRYFGCYRMVYEITAKYACVFLRLL